MLVFLSPATAPPAYLLQFFAVNITNENTPEAIVNLSGNDSFSLNLPESENASAENNSSQMWVTFTWGAENLSQNTTDQPMLLVNFTDENSAESNGTPLEISQPADLLVNLTLPDGVLLPEVNETVLNVTYENEADANQSLPLPENESLQLNASANESAYVWAFNITNASNEQNASVNESAYIWDANFTDITSQLNETLAENVTVLNESANAPSAFLNVTYFEGLLPDFSNLLVLFVQQDGAQAEIAHSVVNFSSSEWALITLERAPGENETMMLDFAPVAPEEPLAPTIERQGKFALFTSKKGARMEIAEDALVRLENNETVRVIVKSKDKLKLGNLKPLKSISNRNMEVLEIDSSSLSELADSGAERIYIDNRMSISLTETIPLIQADRVQSELGYTGEGIAVCLLDTGVDFALPSLEGKAVSGFDFVNNDTDSADDNGHGTLMASVIHAVAPNATILALKVLDSQGIGYSSDIIAGIDYCRQLAAGGQIKIISMSFGGGNFTGYCGNADPVAEEADAAVAEGLFAVASTGNDGAAYITAPACAENATAVSSTSKSDAVSSFSNMNAMVDLLAPGENVLVNGQAVSGTSASAAHLSGAAALLLQSNSSLAPAEAEYRFKTTGKLIEFNGANYTRIDVYNAVLNNLTGEPTNQTTNQSNETDIYTYQAQATSQSKNCGTFQSIVYGDASWGGPGNASTSNNLYANSTVDDFTCTYWLQATNCGFSVPAYAAIRGIVAVVEKKKAATGVPMDSEVYIMKAGVAGTTNFANGTVWPTTDTNVSYGGTTDLWGESWTAADINSSSTGFEISVCGGGPSGTVSVDYMNMTVYYDPPINSCQNLSTANTVYPLNASVSINGATCFNVTAANVTLDCNGFNVTGNLTDARYAVWSNLSNTTIRNCVFKNWSTAIYLDVSANTSSITNVTVRDSKGAAGTGTLSGKSVAGIIVKSSSNSITNSTMYNLTGGNGLNGAGGRHAGNAYGINFSSSAGNTLSTIIIANISGGTAGTCGAGARASGGIGGSAYGIALFSSSASSISATTIANLTGTSGTDGCSGFDVEGATGGAGGSAYGIWLSSSASNNATAGSISGLAAGNGGNGGAGDAGYAGGSGGNGGSTYDAYFSASNTNKLYSSALSAGTGGTGGSGGSGTPNGAAGANGADYAAYINASNSTNATRINATASTGNPLLINDSSSGNFTNSTFISQNQNITLVNISGASASNTFWWNNFTNTSSAYVSDTNGSNWYNTSVGGNQEGNIWYNVWNGSISVTGTVAATYGSGWYRGNAGAGVPYNNATSSGKLSCNFAGCADNVPLTRTGSTELTCSNLSTAGQTYDMSSNLSISGTTCFNVTAQNVTLDCKGYNITGNNAAGTYGLFTSQYNTTVKNCNFRNFSTDIGITGVSLATVQNTSMGTPVGLLVNNTNNSAFTNISFNNITAYGIWVANDSNRNNFTGININATGSGHGIYLDRGANNSFNCLGGLIDGVDTSNTYGAYTNQSNTTLKNCTIRDFWYGVLLNTGTLQATIDNVTSTSNTNHGIVFNGVNSSVINNTYTTSNSQYGVYLVGHYNRVNNLSSSSNGNMGLLLITANSNNVTNSNASGNTWEGLGFSTAVNNTVSNSISDSNAGGTGGCMRFQSTSTGNQIYNVSCSGNTASGIRIQTSSSNNYFENVSNQLSYSSTTQMFQSDAAQNTSSKYNIGWWPFPSSSGSDAAAQANTKWYNGTAGGKNADGTANNTLFYWYNNQYIGCGQLSAANATYTLGQSVSISGATCFNVTAQNVTLDCAGYSITGNNTNLTYGVYTNQFNTTLKNCVITGFQHGVYWNGADNGTIYNVNATTNCYAACGAWSSGIYFDSTANYNTINRSNGSKLTAYVWAYAGILITSSSYNTIANSVGHANASIGIFLTSSSANSITNSNATSASGVSGLRLSGADSNNFTGMVASATSVAGIRMESGSDGNRFSNVVASASSSYGLWIYSPGTTNNNNVFNNTTISSSSQTGAYASNASGSIFANSTITGGGATRYALWVEYTNNSTIYNVTFTNPTGTLVFINKTSTNNTFYWNNFTAAPAGYHYVNDSIGGNWYNTTMSGHGEGNIWADVMNGSVSITGAGASLYGSSLYYGSTQYNNTTSSKVAGNVVDAAPLVVYLPVNISFVPPTPSNGASTADTNLTANVSLNTSGLSIFNWNWNGTNYTLYNDSLVLMHNLDNVSAIGESSSYFVDASRYGNNGDCGDLHGYSDTYGICSDPGCLGRSDCEQSCEASWFPPTCPTATSSGKYNGAYSFDGSLNMIAVNDSSSLKPASAVTIEAWFKSGSAYDWAGIVEKANDDGTFYGYALRERTNGLVCSFTNSTTGTDYQYTTAAVTDNQWHHAVCTYDSGTGTVRMYLDRNRTINAAASGTLYQGTNWLFIGRGAQSADSRWFNGTIDAVRIYNRSISWEEVNQSYASNLYKYNASNWQFITNQTNLSLGSYTYYACANNTARVSNCTDTRALTVQSGTLACSALSTAGMTYNMTSNLSINGATCFNVTAANVTLNCNGSSIIGNNTTGTYGVYSTQNNTTVQNCNISNFYYGVYYSGASNGLIRNNTISSTHDNGADIWITGASANGTIRNNTLVGSPGTGAIILGASMNGFIVANNSINTTRGHGLDDENSGSGTDIVENNTVYVSGNWLALYQLTDLINASRNTFSSTGSHAFYIEGGGGTYANNTFISQGGNALNREGGGAAAFISNNFTSNSSAAVYDYAGGANYSGNSFKSNTSYALWLGNPGNGGLLQNNTLNSTSGIALLVQSSGNNRFINNTLIAPGSTLAVINGTSSGNNTFYWNNFTGTTDKYVNDTNGTNYYNTTISSQAAGNIWYNVWNGSVQIYGNVSAPFANLYYGAGGVGYPYNNTTSLGKVVGNVVDYAPLTTVYGRVPTMSSAFIGSGAANYTYEPSLMTYWKLDETSGTNASDSSGNGRDGTIVGTVNFTENARIGRAIGFDGASSYTNASGFSELGTANQPYTLAGWVKAAQGETNGNIIHVSAGSSGTGWCLPMVNLNGSKLRGISWIGSQVNVTSTTTLSADTWYHFAVTWDSANGQKMYVNGVNENTTAQATYTASGSPDYIFLAFSPGTCSGNQGYFNGSIDDVRVYSRALSATEVNQTYNQTLYRYRSVYGSANNSTDADDNNLTHIYSFYVNGTPYSLINWPFDTNVSMNLAGGIKDYSGNNNSGNLSSATAITWNASGKVGGAYNFDGTTSSYIIRNNTAFPSSALTAEFWAKISNLSKTISPIHYTTAGGNDFLIFNQANINIYVNNTAYATGVSTANTNWHHYAVTWRSSDGQLKLYIDGTQNYSATGIQTGFSFTSGGCLVLAQEQDGVCGGFDASQAFQGTMDQVMVYNRTLSADEIAAHYNLEYNRIVASELAVGQIWNVSVTPNDGIADGPTMMSSQLIVENSTGVDACGILGDAGRTYNLTQSVSIDGATCFNVTAQNVTLNCNGYTITGNNSTNTYGVYSNQFNTTVRNCNIVNFESGVGIVSANNATIQNNNVTITNTNSATAPYGSGFYLYQSSYGQVSGNNVSASSVGIILVTSSTFNTVANNTFSTSGLSYTLDLVSNVNDNTFINNNVTSTGSSGRAINIATTSHRNVFNGTLITTGSTSNGVYISGGENTTIDCLGGSITGNNASGTYGVYSSQYNTTVRNCNISNFQYGAYFSSVGNGTIDSNNLSTTHVNGTGIYITGGGNLTISNNFANSTTGTYSIPAGGIYVTGSTYNRIFNSRAYTVSTIAIRLTSNANYNNLTNSTGATQGSGGLFVQSSSYNTLANCIGNATTGQGLSFQAAHFNNITNCTAAATSSGNALRMIDNSTDNIIANSTLSSNSGVTADIYANSGDNGGSSNTFVNNTFASTAGTATLVLLRNVSVNNTFYWNNFTDTSGLYVNDSSTGGTNYFNSTEGNIWADVMNGSVDISGVNASTGFASLYVGTYGNGWPYNNSTSSKVIGSVADYRPLTPYNSPTITWNNQSPADIDSLNVVSNPANVTYNITPAGSFNNSTAYIYYKTNATGQNCTAYVNGSYYCGAYNGYFRESNISAPIGDTYKFDLEDNEIYPATYNFDAEAIEYISKVGYQLNTTNQWIKLELLNLTLTRYNFFEINLNNSVATVNTSVSVYYCNSSYSTGGIAVNSNCMVLGTITNPNLPNHNHHDLDNKHHVLPFSVNLTTGYIGGSTVRYTSTGYFAVRGRNVATKPVVWGITNVSRTSATTYTSNGGSSWSNVARTIDAHVHQYNGTETLNYHVCVNGTLGTGYCSDDHTDLLDLAGLPPEPPQVLVPNDTVYYYANSINISYTEAVSPNGYPIVRYNISLLNSDESFNQTIIANNSLNLSYVWDASSLSYGTYVVRVTAYDSLGQSSDGLSGLFLLVHCGVISTDNESVTLVSSLAKNGSTCFNVTAQNVSLNCSGYTITGNNSSGYGIYSNQFNTTIANCYVSNFTHAIYLNGANYSTVRNCTGVSYFTGMSGIHLDSGSFNLINNSTGFGGAYAGGSNGGIYVTGSNNTLNNSYGSASAGGATYGIYVGATNNTVANSIGNSTTQPGMYISGSGVSGQNITGISNTSNGITAGSSAYVYLCNGTSTSGAGIGFLTAATSAALVNCTGASSSGNGIDLSAGNSNITNSTGTSSTGHGVRIFQAGPAGNNNILNGTVGTSASNSSIYISGGVNHTVDCNGKTLAGTNTSGTYGVYSSQSNTTVKNCNIRWFVHGIYFNGATYGAIHNDNATSAILGGNGIYLATGSNYTTVNLSKGVTESSGSYGIQVYSDFNSVYGSTGITSVGEQSGIDIRGSSNYFYNCTGQETGGYSGFAITVGSGNTIANSTGLADTGIGISIMSSSTNTIANSTLTTGSGNSLYMSADNNSIINNTFISSGGASTLVAIYSASANNTFYWNNFTGTTGYYVNDASSGPNYYNTTTAAAVSTCYQEFANLSTCGGQAAGSYYDTSGTGVYNNSYDGNWTTYAGGATSSSLMVNYSKPASALNSSVVQMVCYLIIMEYDYSNYSIPANCWSQSVLQFNVTRTSGPGGTSTLYCHNGSAWQSIANANCQSGGSLAEEAMYWNLSAASGQAMGNRWHNVMNGSVTIYSSTSTPTWLNGTYYGDSSAGWPYSNSTSEGKVVGNVADYAPFTYLSGLFVDTVINVTIIDFGSLDPGTLYNPADSAVNLTNTANSNAAVDLYLNNTNMTYGANVLLYNYTAVSVAYDNSSATRMNGSSWINGSSADSGFVENLAIGASSSLYFWQDVLYGQVAGAYNSTVIIRAVATGYAP